MKAEENISERRSFQLSFWQAFKKYCESGNPEFASKFNRRRALAQHWYTLSVGNSDCELKLIVLAQENKVRVECRIMYNRELYMKYYAQEKDIDQFVGCKLKWRETKKGGVFEILHDADINEGSSGWHSSFDWYCETAQLFAQALKKFDT
jgi:hypothetical protein